ncbi:MAG: 3-deoxy-7-phosphoheptulonate synthase [Nanoarchaeota archaeon]
MTNQNHIIDTRIAGDYKPLITLDQLQKEIPRSDVARETVLQTRAGIEAILDGRDPRRLIIMGPCSTHDMGEAIDYAESVKELSARVNDSLLIVQRTFFEKPRTGLGWFGLIVDSDLNGTEDLDKGYRLARTILSRISGMGVACATEYVDTDTPQLIGEFVSWAAIGARTSYSQQHREMASGLSMPVGFKNDTHGDISVAVNGVIVAKGPHSFRGTNRYGIRCVIPTTGNPYGHVVLRGGHKPNYDEAHVKTAQLMLRESNLPEVVIIDCSHDNTKVYDGGDKLKKDYIQQIATAEDVKRQIKDGNNGIVGIMIESNHNAGKQPIPSDLRGFNKSTLKYGYSVTDGCIGLDDTKNLVMDWYRDLRRTFVSIGTTR